MAGPKRYDLSGPDGPAVFRELPEGLKIKLANGALGQIAGNPRDGAFLVVKILESPEDPSKVGEEEFVFFTEVRGVE